MPVDEHTIELAGNPVFYRSAPSSVEPPPLYLHGVPTSSDDWTELLARTGGLAPDLIGFGRSSKAGHLDYTLAGLAQFVELLLDGLGIERVRLVAHSWGAGAGLVLAQRAPERIERLVLCDALPLLEDFTWPPLARRLRTPVLGELVMGSTPRWLLARTLRAAYANPEALSDARVKQIWEQFDQGTQRALLRLHRSTGPDDLATAGEQLGELTVSALIAWGERDPWFEVDYAERYAQRLPNARLERIPDAGHWPWLEHRQLADRIAEFVLA